MKLEGKQTFLTDSLPSLNEQDSSHPQQQGFKQILSLQQKKIYSTHNDKEITES